MKLLKIFIFGLMVILISRFVYSQWYAIVITNTQSQATPAPFQQDIAICNGNINIGPNFAYVNNATIFNQINSNGSNVYFIDSSGNILYSWYEGQLNYNGVTCDVWWINISQGIPANSNITIYMNIGNSSSNYYSLYYPYVGASPQVIPGGISGYDNGQDVFIAYGYFYNTFDGWSGYIYQGSFSPTATQNGIEILNDSTWEGTYILPPNNWNIPKIPLIVEEAWYYTSGADANVIALFGNTSQQFGVGYINSTSAGATPASNLSTFVQFEYWYLSSPPTSEAAMLKSAVTDQYLNYTSFPTSGGTVYSYLIVNSSYAQTGYYIYNSNQVWAPLTLLDMYPLSYNPNYGNYTYSNLNYNPFQYPTLEISAGTGDGTSYQYVEWVVARAYPPNGVMPSISIQSPPAISSISLNPSSSSSVCPGTQISSTVTVNLSNPNNISTTVTFFCSVPFGIMCSLNPSSCPTNGSSCSVTLYVNSSPSGWYAITITNTQNIPTPVPFQQDIAICNGNINIGPNFAYVNNATIFNQINSNGSNVYFIDSSGNILYSWYEGQLNYNGVTCDVWWINISQGIPANSNITIYMNIGPNSVNYYQQYYPYVGTNAQVIGTMQYDNGQDVFIAYGYFRNTFDGWTGYNISGPPPAATLFGILMTSLQTWDDTYILPPNNWNIPKIPLIVEEAWFDSGSGGDANAISLFGNTSNQIQAASVGSTGYGGTPVPNLSTFVQFEYALEQTMLKSAVTNQSLNSTYFPNPRGTFYSYLIVNSTYAQTGYYYYYHNNNSQPFPIPVPLTLLDMYPLSYNPNYGNYTYYNLNYNPFQFGTLEISGGTSGITAVQYVEWVVARAYPPNGVMPSISISSLTSSITYNPGSYLITITASVPGSSASTTYTYNIGPNISISSQSSSNFQNSYSIYIIGCSQNYTLYVNNSPYCYDSYLQFQNINALCTVSYPGSYSVYAQGCYNGTCVNSNTINLNVSSSVNSSQTIIYYGIIQLQANIQPININTTYGPIGNNLEFSLDYPEYILTLNITNIGNITLNNITINLLQLGNVPEILYNQIPIQSLNNINIGQLQPNQSYILQFSVLPLYIGSSSLLLSFNVNGQNIGTAQYNLIVNGPSNKSSLIVSENINYILILAGIIGSIIFLI